MINTPLITVITVSYNAVSTLEKTILSVINQSYLNIEYVIIDGGSTDGTVEIIKKYADKITYWVSEPDNGIYDAMNKGIRVATGEWINFMNSGDFFVDKDVLNAVFKSYIKGNINFIYGNTILNYNGRYTLKLPVAINHLKKGMSFCHQSVFVRTKCISNFNTKYKIAADFDYFHNAYNNYGELSFQYVNIPIAVYEATSGVSTNINATYNEYLQIRKDKFRIIKLFLFKIINSRR